MASLALVPEYLRWHYSRALVDLGRLWKNFSWFIYHFFSVPLLAQTLFSPWRRLSEERSQTFDLEDWGSTLLVNGLMRLVGAIIRIIFIGIGLTALALLALVAVGVFVLWLVLPAVLILFFLVGLKALLA